MTKTSIALLALLAHGAMQQAHAQAIDWPAPSGDAGAMRFSRAAAITRENVSSLQIAWRWQTNEKNGPPVAGGQAARPGQFQGSPIVIGDTMYTSTPYAAVAALDARTGREYWRFDPEIWRAGQPSNGTGLVHRGVATWASKNERRTSQTTPMRVVGRR